MILIKVAAGVILNDQKNKVFLTQRKPGQFLAGLWEFPGGKVESDESITAALYREIKEEIAIEITQFEPLLIKQHDYKEKIVELHCFIISKYLGIVSPQESQKGMWVAIPELYQLEMPEANKEIIESLKNYLSIFSI